MCYLKQFVALKETFKYFALALHTEMCRLHIWFMRSCWGDNMHFYFRSSSLYLCHRLNLLETTIIYRSRICTQPYWLQFVMLIVQLLLMNAKLISLWTSAPYSFSLCGRKISHFANMEPVFIATKNFRLLFCGRSITFGTHRCSEPLAFRCYPFFKGNK